MAKRIMLVCYALCLLSGAMALLTRVLATFGSSAAVFAGHSLPMGYHSFMDGALLFFMLTVASASVAFVEKRSI